jgi:hypothetical protein
MFQDEMVFSAFGVKDARVGSDRLHYAGNISYRVAASQASFKAYCIRRRFAAGRSVRCGALLELVMSSALYLQHSI